MNGQSRLPIVERVDRKSVRKIRITSLINSLESGGAQTVLHRVSTKLDRAKFDPGIISLSTEGVIGKQFVTSGIPVDTLGLRAASYGLRALGLLVKMLRYDRPDVLMTWLAQSDLLGLVACRMARVPKLAWNLRNSAVTRREVGTKAAALKSLGAKFSRWPNVVVVNSLAGLEAHKAIGFHPRRWEMIPNGFDLDLFKPNDAMRRMARNDLKIPDSAPVIGLLAHYRPVKNHAQFLRAAQIFSEKCPEAHFVLAGTHMDEKNTHLKGMCGPLWGDPRLHLIGEQADVPKILSTLDVMAMCSLSEGFPNVIGEAMAMGVPCVVTKSSGDAPRIVGAAGRVVELYDAKGFADAWDELIARSPEEFRAMRCSARQRIEDQYSLDVIVNRYADLLTNLVAE